MGEHTTTDELRAAMARLVPADRQTLAVRWQENADRWEVANPPLGRMWQAMTSLALEVDRLEQARAAAGGSPHVMRRARPARK